MSEMVCPEHGASPACLICVHLFAEAGRGYFAIAAGEEEDESAQAWCEECDHVLEREQGWSDEADRQAAWRLCCTGCYDECLRANKLLGWVQGTSPDD